MDWGENEWAQTQGNIYTGDRKAIPCSTEKQIKNKRTIFLGLHTVNGTKYPVKKKKKKMRLKNKGLQVQSDY
jgi:hypothetical protein